MSVTVTPVNDAPVAVDDTATVAEDSTANVINVLGNDTDPDGTTPTVTAVSNPTGGTVDLTGGVVTFTPTANYTGTAGFDYTLSDGALTDTGHVTVTITAVNDPPVAVDDTVTTDQNVPAVIPTATLTGNDTDIDGGPLTVTAVSGPTNGTVVLNGDNTITFTPTRASPGPPGSTTPSPTVPAARRWATSPSPSPPRSTTLPSRTTTPTPFLRTASSLFRRPGCWPTTPTPTATR